jgi:Rrf2 family protein
MNTRLAVAAHILAFLTVNAARPVSSETLASSVNTNASLVRRMLVLTNKAGLTMATKGKAGGARLARNPETITLLDVYRAVNEQPEVLRLHPHPHPLCPVGGNIAAVLQPRFDRSEATMLRELSTTTIAEIAAEVLARNAARAAQA